VVDAVGRDSRGDGGFAGPCEDVGRVADDQVLRRTVLVQEDFARFGFDRDPGLRFDPLEIALGDFPAGVFEAGTHDVAAPGARRRFGAYFAARGRRHRRFQAAQVFGQRGRFHPRFRQWYFATFVAIDVGVAVVEPDQ